MTGTLEIMAEFDLGEPARGCREAVESLGPARMQPARAGLTWMQPNFEVLRKVGACVDNRHLKIMAENNYGRKLLWEASSSTSCL